MFGVSRLLLLLLLSLFVAAAPVDVLGAESCVEAKLVKNRVVGVCEVVDGAVVVIADDDLCVVVKLVGNRVVGVSELVTDADGSSFPHEMR